MTVIIVPHNDSAPLTVRFPRWLVPSLLALFIVLVAALGYVSIRYRQLSDRYGRLIEEQGVDFERGRDLRSIILSQQEDVKALSEEVQQVQGELDGIRKLSEQVRQLLGLDKAPTPPIPAAPTPRSMLLPDIFPTDAGRGGGNANPLLEPLKARPGGMLLATESAESLDALRPLLPWAQKEMQYLANQALLRLGKIDPARRGSQAQLEAQLRLLAAAPTLWPVRGRITSDFGTRKALFDDTKREFHGGIDIGVWYFTPVKATKDGRVIYAGWRDGYGNVVEIAHEMGYVTIYGHNYDLKVKAGQTVRAGDVIARSGQTGYASGPHVHYEVRLNGVAVDPMRFLDLSQ